MDLHCMPLGWVGGGKVQLQQESAGRPGTDIREQDQNEKKALLLPIGLSVIPSLVRPVM